MDFLDGYNYALRHAANQIRNAIDELAGLEVLDSEEDPRPDFMSDDALRVATVIADHFDPELSGGCGTLLEKLKAAIAVTAMPRRCS